MEENIKILENLKKEKTKWENRIYGVGETRIDLMIEDVIRAIENLINGYKELEEDYTSVYLKGVYDERDKWKSKIKELLDNKFIVLYEGDAEFPDDATEINEVKYINAKYLEELLQEGK